MQQKLSGMIGTAVTIFVVYYMARLQDHRDVILQRITQLLIIYFN